MPMPFIDISPSDARDTGCSPLPGKTTVAPALCDRELLKRSLHLLGLRPETLLLALQSEAERWHVELALRAAHVTFDGWGARRQAPSASADDLVYAQAWLEALCVSDDVRA